jgi:hypothetical protein
MDELVSVVIDNYQNGSLKIEKLYYFVANYPKYIIPIFKAISIKAPDMKPGDVPSLKKMHATNSTEFGMILAKLPSKIQKLVTGEK